ncbi:DUF2332 family protein [Nocardioides sp. R1-1]|uniref:DUF2332 family protein n=1 Tax=Nocardioides sp. R1-1 TaxID=3383502 RepID=UPI0038D248A9
MEPYAEVEESYRRFAVEAADSPTFAAWAGAVADDPELLAWIRALPELKRQPNLVFAAARHHGVPAPGPYDALRAALLDDRGPIRAWLETLVWPEQDERRARLVRAIEVARREPPLILRGDLVDELPAAVDRAAEHGTVVVFHSAVIAYLPPERRTDFDALVRDLVGAGRCHWVSNEGKQVLPSVTATGPAIPDGHPTFVLGIDGRMVAQTHGHGRTLRWTA